MRFLDPRLLTTALLAVVVASEPIPTQAVEPEVTDLALVKAVEAPAADIKAPAANNQQPAANNQQPAADNQQPAADDLDSNQVLLDKLAASLAANHAETDRFDAQVWLMASEQRLSRYMDDQPERLALLQLVYREAHRADLDPDLVLAVMQVESHFEPFAISRVGAQGLMQIMPFWRAELGRPLDNLTDVETNVIYGTTILAHYLEVSQGDLVEALGRYNGSRGRLRYPELVVSAWRKTWRHKSSSELPELRSSCANYGLKACRYQ